MATLKKLLDPSLLRACLAEVIGTYLMVTIGTGSVAAAVLTGAQAGVWQVAAVWGFGVTIAIYVTAAVSGAHLNPSVSLAFAIFRRASFPYTRLAPYWISQLAGAVLAGLTVLWLFGPFIVRFEAVNGLVRGEAGSQHSAMVFGEYFPNPDMFGTGPEAASLISPMGAALVEGFGTAILLLVIFALVDHRNSSLPTKYLAPFFIGFTVAVLISLFSPLTQAGWNPAAGLRPAAGGVLRRLGDYRHTRTVIGVLGLHRGAIHRGANRGRHLRVSGASRVKVQNPRRVRKRQRQWSLAVDARQASLETGL